jgi:uncharacterized OB-fold protein
VKGEVLSKTSHLMKGGFQPKDPDMVAVVALGGGEVSAAFVHETRASKTLRVCTSCIGGNEEDEEEEGGRRRRR